MKQLLVGSLASVGLLAGFTPAVEARETVTCTFSIAQNPDLNIRAATYRETEDVRRRERRRLLRAGSTAYRVIGDGGYHCRLRHDENARFGVRIDKRDMRLDRNGEIPDCADFPISVSCRGGG